MNKIDNDVIEHQKTDMFIKLYQERLKQIYNLKAVRLIKKGSKAYDYLDKARKIADELGVSYSDYISFQFDFFKRIGIPIRASHLASDNAKKRFKSKIKKFEWGYVDGENFVVYDTLESYPLYKILLDSREDSLASFALYVTTLENIESLDDQEIENAFKAICYYIAKLNLKNKIVPTNVLELKEKLKKIKNERGCKEC